MRAEHRGKEPRIDLAEDEVTVGHRQRPALAVACRARLRARALGPDEEPSAVEPADRAAARRHSVDAQHRRADAHPGDDVLAIALVSPREQRDVGRGAAHVEPDHALEPGGHRGLGHAHDPPRGAREDCVLAAQRGCCRKPAVRLHEERLALPQRARQPFDIAAQNRREVGIGTGRVRAPDQLGERRDAVAHRDLLETRLDSEFGERAFVRGVAIPVHQRDGDRAQARVARASRNPASAASRSSGRSTSPSAVTRSSISSTSRVSGAGLTIAQREDVGPFLRTDREQVGKPAGDRQQHRLALALEQRVGGDRGADADLGVRQRSRAHPGQPSHRFDRGVGVVRRVFRKQLGGVQRAARIARDDVGERPPAVDPELPAIRALRHAASLWRIARAATNAPLRLRHINQPRRIAARWNTRGR